MTEIERRLTNIEKRLRNLEARGIVTRENSKQFGSDHAGKKTKEVILQEAISLHNQLHPDEFTEDEILRWSDAYVKNLEDIKQLPESDQNYVNNRLKQFTDQMDAVKRKAIALGVKIDF